MRSCQENFRGDCVGGDLTLPKLLASTIRVAQSRVKSKEENVMNVVAIGRCASRAFDAYVPAGKQRATELREEVFTTGFLGACVLAALLVPGHRAAALRPQTIRVT